MVPQRTIRIPPQSGSPFLAILNTDTPVLINNSRAKLDELTHKNMDKKSHEKEEQKEENLGKIISVASRDAKVTLRKE